MRKGEWKVKIHGADKRQNRIKVHIGIYTDTQELVAVKVTDEKTAGHFLESWIESARA